MRWIIVCALLAGCGDNLKAHPRDDAGIGSDATPDTPDAPGKLTGCLERPGLDMALNGQLPCDLIPPGLAL